MKTTLLLINLGTPDSPKTSDVRRYLNEFLTDHRVIDIPWLPRQILVRGIIGLFRAPKSAATYKKIWTDAGSPLLIYTKQLADALQVKLGSRISVKMAMRYQNPSLKTILAELEKERVEKLIILPLYPQNAASSTSSTIEFVMNQMRAWEVYPEIHIINSFYNHPEYLNAWQKNIEPFLKNTYDYYIFSYHGVPQRHIQKTKCLCSKAKPEEQCFSTGADCPEINTNNHFCYRAQCFENTRQLVERLNLPKDKVCTTFQSRLGKDPWVKPYTDLTLKELVESKGAKRFLVIPPSFVADCLETTYEIAQEVHEEVQEWGGESVTLVPSLNVQDHWVEALTKITKTYIS